MCDGHMWWGGGGLMMILWTVLIIVGILWAIRALQNRDNRITTLKGQDTPLEVIKLRYARGEITKEEFDILKKDLS